jgi:hypothetical protein
VPTLTEQLEGLAALATFGLDDGSLHALARAHLTDPAQLARSSDAQLLAIPGIGPQRLRAVRAVVGLVMLDRVLTSAQFGSEK